MSHCSKRSFLPFVALSGAFWLATTVVNADDVDPSLITGGDDTPVVSDPNPIGQSSTVESKLSNEFVEFLGSEEQAQRVVSGLRTGESFSLEPQDATVDGVSPPLADTAQPAVIDPPTGTMGYGNVRLTLKLAEARLAEYGISQPTNEQLSAVLVGGDIDGTVVEGILNERAAGAGWGEIAQRYDLKVGELMGKGKSVTTISPATETTVTNGQGAVGKSLHAAGGATTNFGNGATHKAVGNGYISSGKGHAYGLGIVSAQGGNAAALGGSQSGKGNGYAKGHTVAGNVARGAGVISAGNATAASVNAGGGKGLAKGHAKGKP